MNPASPITAAATALKDRHAALLNPPVAKPVYGARDHERFVAGLKAESAVKALDAARERLQGGPRPEPDQLRLDVGARP